MTNITPLTAISDLRPIQSASNPANSVEITLPSKHRGDHDGKLAGVQAGGRLQIRQRSGDDADVHAIEQAAQAGHDQKKAVIENLLVVEDCGSAVAISAVIECLHRVVCLDLQRKVAAGFRNAPCIVAHVAAIAGVTLRDSDQGVLLRRSRPRPSVHQIQYPSRSAVRCCPENLPDAIRIHHR